MREMRPITNEKIASIAEQAAVFILSCLDEKLKSLTIGDVAAAVGTNRIHLCREFEIEQETTLAQFIEREIIHRAVFALERDQDISIQDLAKKLSFENVEDFESKFEKYLLIKPGRYKELVKTRANHFYHQKDLLHCHCSFL